MTPNDRPRWVRVLAVRQVLTEYEAALETLALLRWNEQPLNEAEEKVSELRKRIDEILESLK